MANKLSTGDEFPNLTLSIAGGDDLSLPDGFGTPYSIVLFYRGHW